MIITKNPNDYTIEFTAEEQATLDRVESQLDDLIGQWLDSHRRAFAKQRMVAFSEKFDRLATTKRQQVEDILEGRA